MKNYTHKLTETSKRSYYLVLLREIIDKYDWKEKQKLVIKDKGRGKFEIRDWPARGRGKRTGRRK